MNSFRLPTPDSNIKTVEELVRYIDGLVRELQKELEILSGDIDSGGP